MSVVGGSFRVRFGAARLCLLVFTGVALVSGAAAGAAGDMGHDLTAARAGVRLATLASSTFERRVLASADDAEERATGGMYLTSSDLELVYDGGNQKVGMRFTNVTIPAGATITRAYVQFEAKETQSEVTNLLIQGQAADDAGTFTTVHGNISTRPRTNASVAWSPAPWTLIAEAGPDQRTPDLSGVIQEVVSRPGWASGNALAIIITGSGHRTARAYDSKPAGAALLHIEYDTGPPPPPPANTAPIVNAGPDLTVTLPANAVLDGTVTDDGLPNPPGTTSTAWSVDSGPGTVSFQNAAAVDTQASFSTPGTYTLRLTANDSQLSSSDTTQVTALDGPPTAKLSVTPIIGALPLAVTADASASTDTDGTPIASYTFDFGDGSASVGPQAAATAPHTYNSKGTYTITVKVTDSAGLWSTTTRKVTAGPDAPPAAALSVTPASGTAPLNVTADASASSDVDVTTIASYTFDFGDGSAKIGPQANATATHTYSTTGTFTATVTVTDSAGLASTATSTVTVAFPAGPSISVYAGYYDTHHGSHIQPKPDPWMGSPNVFVGKPDSSSGGWDTSAVMITNRGSGALSGVGVTVDIGSKRYALWSPQAIPAGQSLILAQTAFENFDGSDTSPAGCYGCDPRLCITSVVPTIPVVHVTIGGTTTNYQDLRQVLNTQGADKAGCPDTGGTRNDESQAWQQLG
jgi:PKD repeat protein